MQYIERIFLTFQHNLTEIYSYKYRLYKRRFSFPSKEVSAMSWTRTLKTTTHTFIFHKIALLTNQTNLGRSQQPISLSARCTIFPTNYNHGQKSWDTFAFLERFPIHTVPTPPLISQTKLDACIQNFSDF